MYYFINFLSLLFCLNCFSQIDRIDPPNWWVGFKSNTVQLLVKGKNIKNSNLEINYPGIEIVRINNADSPNYLFVDLKIHSFAKPGIIKMLFINSDSINITYEYELIERKTNSSNFIGFDNSDVVYLITPDRFSNGNYDNDIINGLNENKINRADDYARHGGDIKGISNNIDYIKDMGFTAIWTNPFNENNMFKSSYHGYSITDHYKVDPRFGTINELIDFSKKLKSKGIKLIMDQIVNHCGLEHWWIDDLPFDNWVNYQDEFLNKPISIDEMRESPLYNQDSINKYFINTNHRRTSHQDIYASKIDKDIMTDGWFVSTMPDLNHKNEFMEKYLIQNSIWWIETLSLGGIRQDTYPYGDKNFMSKWAGQIMNEFPKFSIVGEEWSYNPLLVNYWQNSKKNSDGYESNLNSVMDFPMQKNIIEGINEKESWNKGLIKIYEGLANDFYYSDPSRMFIFLDNHDMDRVYTVFGHDLIKTKMALGLIFLLPRIPQVLYGTEILMNNSDKPGSHGFIRKDFPGGWKGDKVNGFVGKEINKDQIEAKAFVKKILNFRKNNSVIHKGKTLHFSPQEGIYVLFRYDSSKVIMVIINKNTKPFSLNLNRFNEMDINKKYFHDVINDDKIFLNKKIKFDGPGISIFSSF
tara:strand:- start:3332 stop:5248 length:1917 start_codon:yes stop_codon:yes gene_type:complete